MNYNIPTNDYKANTEIRPEVVQAFSETMIRMAFSQPFHPITTSCYRRRTIYLRPNGNGTYCWGREMEEKKGDIRLRTSEIQEAFKALTKAGWFIHRYNQYGDWLAYAVYKQRSVESLGNVKLVTEFTEDID